MVLKPEDLGCLIAPQLALDEILAGAGLANMDPLLPLGRHHLRCMHQVHDTLPSDRADRSGEAVLTRSLRSEREDVCTGNIADVNSIPRCARQIGFLLRAVQNAPQRLDRCVQLLGGSYALVSAELCYEESTDYPPTSWMSGPYTKGGLIVARSQAGLCVSTNSQAARSASVFEARYASIGPC
jgi:hypothetical protein